MVMECLTAKNVRTFAGKVATNLAQLFKEVSAPQLIENFKKKKFPTHIKKKN